MGFAGPTCHHAAGALLPHHFILTERVLGIEYQVLGRSRLSRCPSPIPST